MQIHTRISLMFFPNTFYYIPPNPKFVSITEHHFHCHATTKNKKPGDVLTKTTRRIVINISTYSHTHTHTQARLTFVIRLSSSMVGWKVESARRAEVRRGDFIIHVCVLDFHLFWWWGKRKWKRWFFVIDWNLLKILFVCWRVWGKDFYFK